MIYFIAQFYNFHHFGNVTMEECIDNIRKIIDKHFHAGTSHRLPDSTLELITNASYFRYEIRFLTNFGLLNNC